MKLHLGKTAKESSALIDKAITSIQTRGKKLDHDIHVAGCSCINHVELHGDTSLLNRLVEAMPKGSRVNALCEWIEVHAKASYNNETKEFQYDKKKSTLLDEAMQKSWVEFKLPPAYQAMDFDKEMKAILKKALARSEANKGDKINSDKLKAVVKAYDYKPEVK